MTVGTTFFICRNQNWMLFNQGACNYAQLKFTIAWIIQLPAPETFKVHNDFSTLIFI